jgi:hypothetical protein
MKGILDTSLPRIGCDFNACGLSDEPNDACYYSFDRKEIDVLKSMFGRRVLLYSYDSKTDIAACEAVVEPYIEGWLGGKEGSVWLCGVRARPIAATWYYGVVPWNADG